MAPDATHPFGTGNCCVFFSGGTYLEPLAVLDDARAEKAMGEGNVFVARDARFRKTVGEEGFSAVVLGTADADADHARLISDGISAGPQLSFSRPFVDARGAEAVASFKLAFALPSEVEDCFFFTCQRMNAPEVDRSALERHDNGAAGIARILMVAEEPSRYRPFLANFSGGEPVSCEDGQLDVRLANARLSLTTPAGLQERFGVALSRDGSRVALAAIVFRVCALAALERRFAANRIHFAHHAGRIVVPRVAGQGAIFIFEEPPA